MHLGPPHRTQIFSLWGPWYLFTKSRGDFIQYVSHHFTCIDKFMYGPIPPPPYLHTYGLINHLSYPPIHESVVLVLLGVIIVCFCRPTMYSFSWPHLVVTVSPTSELKRVWYKRYTNRTMCMKISLYYMVLYILGRIISSNTTFCIALKSLERLPLISDFVCLKMVP